LCVAKSGDHSVNPLLAFGDLVTLDTHEALYLASRRSACSDLNSAIDRRVPRVERAGEGAIARDAQSPETRSVEADCRPSNHRLPKRSVRWRPRTHETWESDNAACRELHYAKAAFVSFTACHTR
jgi:hypothetical protein